MQAPPGHPGASALNASTWFMMEPHESKVGPKARTLDALPPVDSDPGPNRMHLMNLKSGPRPGL